MHARKLVFVLLTALLTSLGLAIGGTAAPALAATGPCPPPPGQPHSYPPYNCKLVIAPIEQKQGRFVRVTGCGFEPGTNVLLRLDDTYRLRFVTVGANSCFSVFVRVPLKTTVDKHFISALGTGDDGNRMYKKGFFFVVAATASPASISKPTATPGQSVVVSAAGFTPNSPVSVDMHSSTAIHLTTLNASSTGAVVSVVIPANTPPGAHTITLTGQLADGSTQTSTANIKVVTTLPSNSALPFTGAVFYPLLGSGVVLMGAGIMLVAVGRRRRTSTFA
jgi:endo-alpha-N-acetylgalactosaminidase